MPNVTDLAVRNLKPAPDGKRYIEWFGDGFGVRVSPQGAKTFVYWYRRGKAKRMMHLGAYPATTLKEALAAHSAARLAVERGEDPAAQKIQSKAAARAKTAARPPSEPTLRTLVAELEASREFSAKASAVEVLRQIRKDILDYRTPGDAVALGDRPLTTLRKRDAVLVIDKVRTRGARIGNACASNFVRLGKFAVRRGLLEVSPFVDFERARLAPRTRALGMARHGAPQAWELARLLDRLPRVGIHRVTVLALLFVLVTGQRPGEVAAMPKSELNRERTLWTIPPERYKTAHADKHPQAHQVPLSPLASKLLTLADQYNAGSPWVFPSPQQPSRHLDPHTLPRALKRKLGTATPEGERPASGTLGLEPFTAHDLRRTCRSWLAVLGVPDHIAERVLGHKLGGILAVYNQHAYLDERRAALEQWATHLRALCPSLGEPAMFV